VRREEVEVAFNTVLKNNATVFKAFVGQTTQPEIWQPVDPLQRAATTVYLPGIPGSGQLIANLTVQPFVSPNGDGIGDAAQIRFNVLKVDAPPEVQIYTLDGRLINTLKGQLQADQSHLYSWSAQDRDGAIVAPGSYLCRIGVDAQAGVENLLRVISVVY
jgi:hypothetical protein